MAARKLKETIQVTTLKMDIDKKILAKDLKQSTKIVVDYLEELNEEQKLQLQKDLEANEEV